MISTMINFIVLLGSLIIYTQGTIIQRSKSCDICIIDSTCTDDTIYFNVSISKYCRNPLNVFFTYLTDVNRTPRPYNTTTTCTDCYTSIEIDAVHDAWDYILTLESPTPSRDCPTRHVAHCGGDASRLIWYITGGLSGLFLVSGILVCSLKRCRTREKPIKSKKKKVEVSVINA